MFIEQLKMITNQFIDYIPSIVFAIIILIIGKYLVWFVLFATSKVITSDWMKKLIKGVMWFFILIMVFNQLGIDLSFLMQNVTIIIAGLMLGVGLAVGLGGKDFAKHHIDKLIK